MQRITWVLLFVAWGCDCNSSDPGDADGAVTGMDSATDAAADSPGTDSPGLDNGTADDGGVRCQGIDAVVRDFDTSHPDFQADNPGVVTGLVRDTLDGERKPVFAHDERTGGIDSTDSFRQWYRDVDGINQAFMITLPLTETSPGQFVFEDDDFFPLDGMGFGMSGEDREGEDRNFHFTTEVHIGFVYEGGEVFTFRGDDDLWLFINDAIAIDLGGVHAAEERSVALDDLGLTPGERYPMDIFHAERHTSASNFRIETTIACFVDPVLI